MVIELALVIICLLTSTHSKQSNALSPVIVLMYSNRIVRITSSPETTRKWLRTWQPNRNTLVVEIWTVLFYCINFLLVSDTVLA